MKKLFLIVAMWQAMTSLHAQSYAQNSTIIVLLEQSESHIYQNLDSALFYGRQALVLAEKNKEAHQLFMVYRTMGYIYEENNYLQEASKEYKKALDLATTFLGDIEKCEIFNDWAIINKKLGHYPIANEYHWATITLAEKLKNWEIVESGYNGLGTMYAILGDNDNAIVHYQKSLESAKKWDNKLGVVLTLENIADIYLKLSNYKLAKENLDSAYILAQELNDLTRIAAVVLLQGDVEMSVGNYESAKLKYQKSTAILKQSDNKTLLSKSYMSMGTLLLKQKEYQEARDNFIKSQNLEAYIYPVCSAEMYQKMGQLYVETGELNKAISAYKISLRKSDSLSLKELARENHLALANILTKQNQHQAAYQHTLIANKLGDQLYADVKQKSNHAIQFKLDIEKRDAQIIAQQKEISQSNTIRLILGSALLLVVGILIFTWRQMKAKLNAMQHIELLMKELHHRVKNNLQTVTSIMRLQARQITDPSVLAVLGESRSRLEAISMIHQQLYRSDDVQSVNFKLFLESLVEKQLFTHGMNDKDIETDIVLEHEYLNVDVALPLGLIINELLTNSFKYAYPSVSNPKLHIELSHQKLFYADNGNGLPAQFSTESTKSFGVQLISSLAQQLRGKFSFGNDNGMFFKLVF